MPPTKEEDAEAKTIIAEAINEIHQYELGLQNILDENLETEDNVACLTKVLKSRGIPKIVEKAVTGLGTAYGLLLAANEDLIEMEASAEAGLPFGDGDSQQETPPEE